MRDYFEWAGINTAFHDVYVFWGNVDASSSRVYEQMVVPGRNGVLLMDEGRYNDVPHEYDVVCVGVESLERLRAALLSKRGYHRLSDTFHGDEFYKACLLEAPVTEVNPRRDLSRMRVVFQRRPERFLAAGDEPVHFTADGFIVNPTGYEAKPLLRIFGDGEVGVGSVTITTSGVDGYVDLDCESMQASKNGVAMNSKVSVSGFYMPTLPAGKTGVTVSGVTVDITPRWWRL